MGIFDNKVLVIMSIMNQYHKFKYNVWKPKTILSYTTKARIP